MIKKKITNRIVFNKLNDFEQAQTITSFARDYYGYPKEYAIKKFKRWLKKRATKQFINGEKAGNE